MIKNHIFDKFKDKRTFHIPKERPPHPSIYKKIKKTEKLIEDSTDPNKFITEGGLDIETHKTIKKRNEVLDQSLTEFKESIHKQILKEVDINQIFKAKMPCDKIEPVTGTRNALVLPINFKNKLHKSTSKHFQKLLFTKGAKSMRDYYLDASWNQLDIKGDVAEWTSAKRDMEDYVDKLPEKNPKNGGIYFPKAQKLVEEAVMNAHKNGIDFSKYDNNGDGFIDMLFIIYAGVGFDTSLNINYINPHADNLKNPITFNSGKKKYTIKKYAIIPELSSNNLKPCDLGCFCHEMAHILGIPELYNPDFTADLPNFSPVMGNWCLMGSGSFADNGRTPTQMGAWCKTKLGWVDPILIKGKPEKYIIPVVTDPAKKIYKIEVHETAGKEYFLIENREQSGFDQYIPASGLLIWHVDENRCLGEFPNSSKENYFLSLEQADGKRELELTMKDNVMDIRGDAGDVFPGEAKNKNFDDTSKPNSKSYAGKKSGVQVTSISEPGNEMTALMGLK